MRYYKFILGGFLLIILILGAVWIEGIRSSLDPRSSLRILDERGVLLVQEDNPKFGARTWVKLGQISPKLIEAVLNQEDRHFYEHHGIDPRGLGRAL